MPRASGSGGEDGEGTEDEKVTVIGIETMDMDGYTLYTPHVPTTHLHYKQCIGVDQYTFEEIIRPGESVVLDVGACEGMASLQAARLGAASVFAFEPSPQILAALRLLAQDWPTIQVVESAVSDVNGMLTMELAGMGVSRIVAEGDGERYVTVPSLRLDTFVGEHCPRVDIIKMDTEGCERRVLLGAEEVLRRDHPILVMSAYHLPGDDESLPELVRQICPEYGDAELLPADNGRERVLRMRVG